MFAVSRLLLLALAGTAPVLAGVAYLTHSINHMALLRKFIWKGQTAFKIDFTPMTLEACQRFTRHTDFPVTEDWMDETIGCIGLVGDFGQMPYALNRFDTSEDFLALLTSPDFLEVSLRRRTTFLFQINLIYFRDIVPERVLLIDFLDRLIDVAEANPYLQLVLNNRFPEKLERYCYRHPVGCGDRLPTLRKIWSYTKFFCEYTYTWPEERQVFNTQAKYVQEACQHGFSHPKSQVPFIFWEYNSRNYTLRFLQTTELHCPRRNGHPIRLAGNYDPDFFYKAAYLDNLTPPEGSVYQRIGLAAGATRFLGQKVQRDGDLVGLRVSDSEGGVFAFEFFKVEGKGNLQPVGNLFFPNRDMGPYVSMTVSGAEGFVFCQNGVFVFGLTPNGGNLAKIIRFGGFEVRVHAELATYEPSKGVLEFYAAGEVGGKGLELLRVKAQGEQVQVLARSTVSLSDKDPKTIRSVIFRVSQQVVYYAFDFMEDERRQSLVGAVGWGETHPKVWRRVLGSVADFEVDSSLQSFVLIADDMAGYYGHQSFNNNNYDSCSAFMDHRKTRLRDNMRHSASYFYGRLSYLTSPAAYDNGEPFISPCDPAVAYGLVGNAFRTRVSFVTHAGEPKLLVAEQPVLVRDMETWVILWSAVFDVYEDHRDLFVSELRPERYFAPTIPVRARGILVRNQ